MAGIGFGGRYAAAWATYTAIRMYGSGMDIMAIAADTLALTM